MASFTNFFADRRKYDSAQKRGGGLAPVNLDAASADGRFDLEPSDDEKNPEILFDRAWANTLIERVLKNLQQDCQD